MESQVQINAEMNPSIKKKIIKRYSNRKLYDMELSGYVTLEDLARMVRCNEDFIVIDNNTKIDITAITLTQIIFETERKQHMHAPISVFKEIIKNYKGNLSQFLIKLGAFTDSDLIDQNKQSAQFFTTEHVPELEKNNLKDEYYKSIISTLIKQEEIIEDLQIENKVLLPEHHLPFGILNEDLNVTLNK